MEKLNESQKQKVNEILADKLVLDPSLDEIKDDSSLFNDLGADSLDVVEVIMEIEKQFNVSIEDKWFDKPLTVNDLYTALENSL